MDLSRLDAELGGTMRVQLGGRVVELKPAAEVPWNHVLVMLEDPLAFGLLLWPADAPISWWRLEVVRDRWVMHNGLPSLDQSRRLLYMVQKFGEAIEYDLRDHLQLSFGDLFRARRWRELLGYIDQLPADTHLNRLLTNDEEYMEAVIRNTKGESSKSPSMASWSQEVDMLASLIDAVNRLTATTQAVAGSKNPNFTPYPRPATVADKVRFKVEQERHSSMVSMLLPNRG